MTEPILAAGGLLERTDDAGNDPVQIAIIHRHRYQDRDGAVGDWVLPKGKQEPGETLEATAEREVCEETGMRARIVGPAYPSHYHVNGVPKVVVFFRMAEVDPGDSHEIDTSEVQEVVWLEPRAALQRLTYESERDIVRDAYGIVE